MCMMTQGICSQRLAAPFASRRIRSRQPRFGPMALWEIARRANRLCEHGRSLIRVRLQAVESDFGKVGSTVLAHGARWSIV